MTGDSKAAHTPEPWHSQRASKSLHPRSYQRVITSADYEYVIAELMQFGDEDTREANARRIVACVNACAGVETERLEEENDLMGIFGRMRDERAENERLRAQVARLQSRVLTLMELRSRAKHAERHTTDNWFDCHDCESDRAELATIEDALAGTEEAR